MVPRETYEQIQTRVFEIHDGGGATYLEYYISIYGRYIGAFTSMVRQNTPCFIAVVTGATLMIL